jgi:uncharacterized protein YsxB (DUF464 family)
MDQSAHTFVLNVAGHGEIREQGIIIVCASMVMFLRSLRDGKKGFSKYVRMARHSRGV